MTDVKYEQRHFNRLTRHWSNWYPSSERAYREHCAGPVRFFEMRVEQVSQEFDLSDAKKDGWCDYCGCGNDGLGRAHLEACTRPKPPARTELGSERAMK